MVHASDVVRRMYVVGRAVACALRGNGGLQPALTGRTPRQEISTDDDLSI